jgi:transcriptional regulator with XRE-family HTH domain
MIKIDGEKIKALREKQGLTQLYMATAVEVTTDTISRWENKRYPTIKKENAQKLAETLGVDLDDILLFDEQDFALQDSDSPLNPAREQTVPQRKKSRVVVFILIAATLISLAIIFVRVFLMEKSAQINAVRIMPEGTLPNSPFPVVIEMSRTSSHPTSVILKEMLPEGSKILEISPEAGASTSAKEVKWIHKLEKTTRFSYLVQIDGTVDTEYTFNGSLSTSKTEETIPVQGKSTITLGQFHWADIDGDNTISDQEILTVFDYYSGIDGFAIDIERIEKMWLGSRYVWDEEKNDISISP